MTRSNSRKNSPGFLGASTASGHSRAAEKEEGCGTTGTRFRRGFRRTGRFGRQICDHKWRALSCGVKCYSPSGHYDSQCPVLSYDHLTTVFSFIAIQVPATVILVLGAVGVLLKTLEQVDKAGNVPAQQYLLFILANYFLLSF